MEIEFDVKITIKELYNYLLYKAYTNIVGIFETIVGIILVTYFIFYGGYLYFLAGAVVLFYLPLSLYTKAVRQLAQRKDYLSLIHYKVTEVGIFLARPDHSRMLHWPAVLKVKSIGFSIILITELDTIILPKKDIEKVYTSLLELIRKHVSANQIEIRQKKHY